MSVVVFVTVVVPKDAEEEFLKAMKIDVEGSRAEEGCLRFDLLKGEATEAGVPYHFYEAYKDADAAAFHKTTPHYKAWADFKAGHMETVGASQVPCPCANALILPPAPTMLTRVHVHVLNVAASGQEYRRHPMNRARRHSLVSLIVRPPAMSA